MVSGGAGEFRSSDPRDKVYAVLSLSAEYDAPAFQPDYTAPVAAVYTATATYIHDSGVPLLAECGRGYEYPYRHHAHVMQVNGCGCAACGRLPDPLPSWVPNWSATRFHAPLEMARHEHDMYQHMADLGPAAAATLSSLARLAFQASGAESVFRAETTSPPPWTVVTATAARPRLLSLLGCRRVARVARLAVPFAPAYVERKVGDVDPARPPNLRWHRSVAGENLAVHGPDAWEAFAERHLPALVYRHPVRGRTVTRKEAFCHTILADKIEGAFGAGEIEARYDEFVENLRRIQVKEEPTHVVMDTAEKRARHQAFHGPLGTACLGRRLGVADGGYLGLFPLGAREGDEVWLVSGASTPLVLRPCEEGLWENVGECYIHGIMHGEAWCTEGLETILLR